MRLGGVRWQETVNHSLLKKKFEDVSVQLLDDVLHDLDEGCKPNDNQKCIVYGDGVKGERAIYCNAIDRFILNGMYKSLRLKNPRKYVLFSVMTKY